MQFLSRRRAVLASVVVLAAFAAALIGGLGLGASSGATGGTTTAPDWLQAKTTQLVTVVCCDPKPASVSWQLATAGKYAQAAALTDATADAAATDATADAAAGAPTDSGRPLYVVVAHGDFTYTAAHLESAGAPLPHGQTLVVAFDPETHIMTDLSLLGPDTKAEAALGAMNPMAF